jgi:multisubunit Na+/H+ antiporter MnhC subunit
MPRLSWIALIITVIAYTITVMIMDYKVYADEERPPLIKSTNNKNYTVELSWEPVEITPNRIILFNVKIIPSSNNNNNVIVYDFIVKSDDNIIKKVNGVRVIDNISTHTVEFPSAGRFNVIININEHDSVTFDVLVASEFPSAIIVTVIVISLAIILSRISLKINNLYSK